MAIKVMIKRKVKNGKLSEVSKLLMQVRYNAMNQPGYISSETLSGCEDPSNVVVMSMWQKIEDWNKWNNSDERSEIESRFELLLDGPAVYENYNVGLDVLE